MHIRLGFIVIRGIIGLFTVIVSRVMVLSPSHRWHFRAVIERGAVSIEPPTNKEWGVWMAYFKVPGALKCEIEGPLSRA